MTRTQRVLEQALRTVEDEHPNAIREHLAAVFIELAGIDSAALLSIAETEAGPTRSDLLIIDRSCADGRAGRMRDFAAGKPVSDAFFDPSQPNEAETRRFHRYADLAGPDWASPGGVFDTYHAQFGYTDAARVLVYDDLLFSQYICVQGANASGLPTQALRAANSLLPSLAAGIVFAVRKDRRLLDQRPTVVFDAAGQVVDASRAATEWLDSGRRSMLASMVRQFDRTPDDDSEGTVDFARYRIVRMVDSGSRYVVMLDRAGVPQRSGHSLLTPREQEVADLLASGATIPDAAAWLGVAESTVKTHARSLYKKLYVSNRVELVEALRRHNS